jgi:RNA polymerase sigma factor (sigma-70 family)
MEELLRRYEPLIGAIVARLRLPCGCERSDIAQEARLGLLRAIGAWQPARGPFRAFAALCARGQALKALDTAGARKHQLLSRAQSLDATNQHRRPWPRSRTPVLPLMTCVEPGESLFGTTVGEQLASTGGHTDPVRALLAREHLESVLAGLPALTEKERTVLAGVLNDKSQQQLADEQHSTRKAISTALRRARHKLGIPDTLAA